MSLLKYSQAQDEKKRRNGSDKLHFGRAVIDGMPFKGPPVPLREDEIDALTVESFDVELDMFDLAIPEQKAKATEVMDKICNGLYRKIAYAQQWAEVNGRPTMMLFICWAQPYKHLDNSKTSWLQGVYAGASAVPPLE